MRTYKKLFALILCVYAAGQIAFADGPTNAPSDGAARSRPQVKDDGTKDDDDGMGENHLVWVHRIGEGDAALAYLGAANFAGQKAGLSIEINSARVAYWAAYPNGANLQELATAYGDALNKKAAFYLEMNIGSQVFSGVGGGVDATGAGRAFQKFNQATGEVDGGYNEVVEGKFNAWTSKIGIIPNPAKDQSGAAQRALSNAKTEWQNFCEAEIRHEYFMYSPTSPIRSSDPAMRFIFVAIEHGGYCDTFAKSKALYKELVQLLGTATVQVATDAVIRSPKTINLATALSDAACQSTDDRVYAFYLLQGDSGVTGMWNAASSEWTRLVAAAGEDKVRTAVAAVRSAKASKVMATKKLYASLGLKPLVDKRKHDSAVSIMYSFADIGGPAWNCVAVDGNGRLIGLRVRSNDSRSSAYMRGASAQRLAVCPWIADANAKTVAPGKPALSDARDPACATEVVNLDPSTGKLAVLATISTATVEGQIRSAGAPLPGSLLVHDGWIYATEATNGTAFRLREDGSGFSFLPVPHAFGERPLFWGVDAAGRILGSTGSSIFAISPDGTKSITLATDGEYWICPGAVAPDGTIYFSKYLKPAAAKPGRHAAPPSYLLMAIDKAGGPARERAETLRKGREQGRIAGRAITAVHDGRLFSNDEISDLAEFSGNGWSFQNVGGVILDNIFAPMIESDGQLFGIRSLEDSKPSKDSFTELFNIEINGHHGRVILRTSKFRPATGLVKIGESTLVGISYVGGSSDDGFIYAIDIPLATSPGARTQGNVE